MRGLPRESEVDSTTGLAPTEASALNSSSTAGGVPRLEAESTVAAACCDSLGDGSCCWPPTSSSAVDADITALSRDSSCCWPSAPSSTSEAVDAGDATLSRGVSHTGAKFRAHEPGDAFAWSLLVPWCAEPDLLAAAAPTADRAAIESNLGALVTVNALILGFCTSLAFDTTNEAIAAYAPLYAKGEYCCTDLDDRGLCQDEAMVAAAKLRITEELMQPALLCQTTAIVVCVLGAGMLYSLSTGYFRGASDEVLGQWACAFDLPMKTLMGMFVVVSPQPPVPCTTL